MGELTTKRSAAFAGRPPAPGEVQPGLENKGQQQTDAERRIDALNNGQIPEDLAVDEAEEEGKPWILIENTTAKLTGIGVPPPKEQVEFRGIVPGDPKVKLMPGVNKVIVEDWLKAKEQKMVLKLLEVGDLKEYPNAKGFAELEPADIKTMVPRTFSRRLLLEWSKADKRRETQRLIALQIDLLVKQHRDTDIVKLSA